MNGFTAKLEQVMLPIGNKLATNKYLTAINGGFMLILPLTIFGSLFTLLGNLPIEAYTNWLAEVGLKNYLSIPGKLSVDMIALYTVFCIAYAYGRNNKINAVATGLAALVGFLIVTPMLTSVVGETAVVSIGFDWLGAKGLFVAMFVALSSAVLFEIVTKKGWVIKMPEGVPPMVSQTFSALIPIVIIGTLFLGVNYLFNQTTYGSIHQCVYNLIQTPLTKLGTNLGAILTFSLVAHLLWWFGIHGGNVVNSITMPIFFPLALENLAAYQAGEALPHIYTGSFSAVFTFGGAGCTIALCILMIRAKSQRYKALGKLALPANIFFINEPIIFGTPIVLNPIMLIPFVLAPIINILIGYFSIAIGLVPRLIGYQIPWTTPPIISGFIQGGWRVAVLQVVIFFITLLIYYPFFKVADKQALEEEAKTD